MNIKELSLEELAEIAKVYISEMAKTEKGKELLRRFAAGHYISNVSVIDQLPTDLAEDFAQSLKEVYEKLIKAKDEAKSHPC